MIGERVPAALAGERLDRIVALLADVSRSAAAAAVAAGGVRVDGEPATSGKVRLDEGALVEVDPAAIPRTGAADRRRGGRVRRRLRGRRRHRRRQAGRVGRPPRCRQPGRDARQRAAAPVPASSPTSASRCVRASSTASTPAAPGCSSSPAPTPRPRTSIGQFAAHTAGRRYDAVAWGHPDAPHGIIDAPIGRDPSDPLRMAVVVDGKPARTEYEVTARFDGAGRAGPAPCRLETGRTHQIRVHLAAIGHPLVGDPTYGDRRTTLGLARPFLHAAELSFDHPATASG